MVTSIVDFSGTAQFNRLIEEISPNSMMNLVSARDIGVDTVLDLQSRLAAGDLLVIAGDRTSATSRGKTETLSFLGETAEFPQGAFILASLMDAPVYFMFGVREDDMDPLSLYDMHVIRARTDFAGSRKERKQKIRSMIEEYIAHLERLCGEHPLQWYNFYDFWRKSNK
jgi:predicted LPLAT superfamily acyltransferase